MVEITSLLFLEGALSGLFVLFMIVAFFKSIYSIGPTQIGLVRKRFGAKLPGNNPVAFVNEAGYQSELLMPGLRLRPTPWSWGAAIRAAESLRG
jgi:uncharacterized membrane protein YqiK